MVICSHVKVVITANIQDISKNSKHFNVIIKIFYRIDRHGYKRKRIADYSAITLFCVNLQVVRTI